MSTFHNPFLKRRPNPKRRTPHRVGNGRVRLHGEDMADLRRQAFERSRGRCEEAVDRICYLSLSSHTYTQTVRCNRPITWESMELSHEQHGPNKSDTLTDVRASCKECHREKHNPKPNPRKPGRKMNQAEAAEDFKSSRCWCKKNTKKPNTPFCIECTDKLSPQTRRDLMTLTGGAWLQARADAEMEILKWRAP